MQDGPLFKFEKYAPDLSSIETNVTTVLANVLARADGYGPVPSFQALTASLRNQPNGSGNPCRGAIFARNPVDGSVEIFAATAQDLWRLDPRTLLWLNVSKGATTTSPAGTPVGTVQGLSVHGGANGSGYTPGTYTDVALIAADATTMSHGGGGILVDITVEPTIGAVLFVGSGTTAGVPVVGGSMYRTGDQLTVPQGALGVGGSGLLLTVDQVTQAIASGHISNPGTYPTGSLGVHTGVVISGGSGTGAAATVVISSVFGTPKVTTVTITNFGNMLYVPGDVLTSTALSPTIQFQYTVDSIGIPPPGSVAMNLYSLVNASDNWQFAQFNNLVVAVQANSLPQKFTMGSSDSNNYFADLSGTVLQDGSQLEPSHIAVINQFLVFSGLNGLPFRVQWCDFGQPEVWQPGFGLANYQDMPDGGPVHDVRGTDQYGLIFQDASIRMMTLAFGSPFVFQILRVSSLDGVFGQYSTVNTGDKVFFCSPQGFKKIDPGGTITPIGKELVDRTFLADIDQGNLQLFIAATDPRSTRVYWMYKSLAGQIGLADKVLIYDWALDRWTPLIGQQLEYLFYLTKPAITLEQLDVQAPGAMTPPGAGVLAAQGTTGGGTTGNTRLTLSALNSGTPPSNYELCGGVGTTGGVAGGTIGPITGGTGYTNGSYKGVPLIGSATGSGATADITVSGHAVTAVTVNYITTKDTTSPGTGYRVGDVLGTDDVTTKPLGSGSGFGFAITALAQSQATIEFSRTSGGMTIFDNPGGLFEGLTIFFAVTTNTPSTGTFTIDLFTDAAHANAIPISDLGPNIGQLATANIGGSVDQMPVSFDDLVNTAVAQIGAFGTDTVNPGIQHALGLFTGGNLQALLETPDQDLGERLAIYWLRPLTDAPLCSGAIGARDTAQMSVHNSATPDAPAVYNAITQQGLIPVRSETRYARASIIIPANQVWSYITGCKAPDTQPAQGDR